MCLDHAKRNIGRFSFSRHLAINLNDISRCDNDSTRLDVHHVSK